MVRKFLLLLLLLPGAGEADTGQLYETHCAECHGAERQGKTGPALLPGNLSRLPHPQAIEVVKQGRNATQMPAFGDALAEDEIEALVSYIYQKPDEPPAWGKREIADSHWAELRPEITDPQFDADPMNLFVVVEKGDHHVTILDGDRFEPIHRFESRKSLHGGPKFSPEGRYVYFASRDGWISKFDLYALETVAEIRAGINTRNIAVSADGKTVLVGNYLPHSLVLLQADDLSLIRVIDVRGRQGASSRVSAVYTAPPRETFVIALKDVAELWEIDYSGNDPGSADPRRIQLTDYLDDFFFDLHYRYVVGAARPVGSGDRDIQGAQVIDLHTGERLASLDLAGMPHVGSGITWSYKGRRVMASPNLKNGNIAVIDMESWETVKHISTLGPGFFMRSHENSRYAWADVFFGPEKDAMHVIDKQTLEVAETLRPAPGKTSAHVEFTKDGAYALVSIWEDEGALVVYDAETLEEIRRLPMRKPSGKYNVYNKTQYSEGTSH